MLFEIVADLRGYLAIGHFVGRFHRGHAFAQLHFNEAFLQFTLGLSGPEQQWSELADKLPEPGEIRVRVSACGVCRTDLHVVDGELPDSRVPIIPGHEIVGRVEAIGQAVGHVALGERVGVPWLGYTCGVCPYCLSGQFIASYRSLDRSHQQAGFGSS